MTDALDYKSLFEAFKKKPEIFFEKVLGVEHLEDYQREAIQSVADFERVCIAACHDLGKTFLIARIVLWYCITHPYSKVITTAPTYNQVKNILWAEIRSAHSNAKINLGGVMNLTEWKLSEQGDWFAIGFTPKNEVVDGSGQGTQSSFQGFHAHGGILVVFDEATGVPYGIWTMAEGLLTQHNVKFVVIGNPTSTASEFYNCFKSAAWKKIYLSCFNSPNLIANGITNIKELEKEVDLVKAMPEQQGLLRMQSYKSTRPYLLSLKWVVASIIKWGINHPLSVSKILGKFPDNDVNALVSLGSLELAQARVYWPTASDRKTIGVDVARYGTDSTVLTAMHGKKVLKRIELFKHGAVQVCGEVMNLVTEIGGCDVIVVDETGVGGGVVDILQDNVRNKILKKCEVRGVQFGASANDGETKQAEEDREKYFNIKARMFDLLAKDLKDENGIQLLDDSIYLEELPSIKYEYTSKGQMKIQSKDEYKRSTGRKSPDSSDSLALANFGNYDSLTIGSFGQSFFDNQRKPIANGLKSSKSW